MSKENRIIIIQLKLQLRVPNYNICMVSNYNGSLKHKMETLVRLELWIIFKEAYMLT